jgi:hypothetical protein
MGGTNRAIEIRRRIRSSTTHPILIHPSIHTHTHPNTHPRTSMPAPPAASNCAKEIQTLTCCVRSSSRSYSRRVRSSSASPSSKSMYAFHSVCSASSSSLVLFVWCVCVFGGRGGWIGFLGGWCVCECLTWTFTAALVQVARPSQSRASTNTYKHARKKQQPHNRDPKQNTMNPTHHPPIHHPFVHPLSY